MLVRRIARPMLALGYVSSGWDAFRHPDAHVDRIEARWAEIATRFDAVPVPDPRILPGMVRLHGAAMVLAGTALAFGRTPRLAGAALAGLSAPLLALDQPWFPRVPRAHRAERLERTVRDAMMVGAGLLVAADLEGRPGIGWRVARARADRAERAENGD